MFVFDGNFFLYFKSRKRIFFRLNGVIFWRIQHRVDCNFFEVVAIFDFFECKNGHADFSPIGGMKLQHFGARECAQGFVVFLLQVTDLFLVEIQGDGAFVVLNFGFTHHFNLPVLIDFFNYGRDLRNKRIPHEALFEVHFFVLFDRLDG